MGLLPERARDAARSTPSPPIHSAKARTAMPKRPATLTFPEVNAARRRRSHRAVVGDARLCPDRGKASPGAAEMLAATHTGMTSLLPNMFCRPSYLTL